MDELLQKLLETDVLSDEVKKELEETFKTQIDEAAAAAREEAAADVRAELTEQWIQERENLIEAVDTKVTEYLANEIEELKEDIESFRDLEAEYAEKIVEAKASMADELKSDLTELVEKIDAFLEIRIAAEIEELREDITEVRKNDFGRRMFEAFSTEYMKHYADDESYEGKYAEAMDRVTDLEEALEESEKVRMKMEREAKLEEVLSPLSGRSKEVMEAILKNVDTAHLEEGYKTFLGRVLKETDETDSEKEDEEVLAESNETETKPEEETVTETVVLTGDTEEVITESEETDTAQQERLARIKRLAGI